MGVFDKWFGGSGFFSKVRMRFVHTFGNNSTTFDRGAYEQATVRAIIDCIATHTAKAQAHHVIVDTEGRIKKIVHNSPFAKLLNQRPNEIMSGYDLKYKLITQLESYTTALAYIDWDERGGKDYPRAIYPVNYRSYEFLQLSGGDWAVRFVDSTGTEYVLPLDDVIVLRKFYNTRDIGGDGNAPVYDTLDLIKVADEGMAEAVKVSNKIRGLLKQKNARFDDEEVQASAKKFADNMREAAKGGGVVGMDLTEEYLPIKTDAYSLNAAQLKDIRDGLYRYWRISESILKSDYDETKAQSFYEAIVEPKWEQLGQAFTNAAFNDFEYDQGNRLIFVSSMLIHASNQTKANIIGISREVGFLTINEMRGLFGYAPVEGGDVRQVSLNYTKAANQDEYQGVNQNEEEKPDAEEQKADEPGKPDEQPAPAEII